MNRPNQWDPGYGQMGFIKASLLYKLSLYSVTGLAEGQFCQDLG